MKLNHIDSHRLLLVIILIIGFFVSLSAVNMYFMQDDIYYLYTSEHTTLIQAIFHPMDMELGWLRPVVAVTWYFSANLWGNNTWGYQLLIAALFTAILYLVYRLGKEINDRTTGVIASALYLAFFPLIISTWQKATLCYLFETAFSIMAIIFFIKSIKTSNNGYLLLSILAGVLAFLSREAAIVLFLIFIAYVIIYRLDSIRKLSNLPKLLSHNTLRSFIAPAVLGILSISLYLLISLNSKGLAQNTAISLYGILFNLATMLGTYGIFMNASLIALAVIVTFMKGSNGLSIAVASIVLGLSLFCVTSNIFSGGELVIGLSMLLLIGIAFVLLVASFLLSGPDDRFALAIFSIALLPPLISIYVGYGYYYMSAAGLSIFIAIQLSKWLKGISLKNLVSVNLSGLASILCLAILVMAIIWKAQYIPFMFSYLDYNTDVSLNQNEILSYLCNTTPMNSVVYQDDRPAWSTKMVVLGRDQNLDGIVRTLTRSGEYDMYMQLFNGRGDITFKHFDPQTIGELNQTDNTYFICYNDSTKELIKLPQNITLNLIKTFSVGVDHANIYEVKTVT